MNLTNVDCFESENFLEVILKPAPFLIKRNGPIVNYQKVTLANGRITASDNSVNRSLPSVIFDVQFKSWLGSSTLHYKTQEPYAATKIHKEFYITDILDGTVQQGQPGDYLVTRSSGINFVVDKEFFEKNYVKCAELNNYLKSSLSNNQEEALIP